MACNQRKTKAVAEFGDFQTPPALARAATQILCRLGIQPRSILEPTCGRGAFVTAAASSFPTAESIIGIDINPDHLAAAHLAVNRAADSRIELRRGDFFELDWKELVAKVPEPWLVLGNPPWVTSAELGAIESGNLPAKSNFHGRRGIDAITGKSNFDISEWMLLRYLDWLEGTTGTIAVLCKTAVARKILLQIWKKKLPMHAARIYKIDALEHFGAAVDACFFVVAVRPNTYTVCCDIFNTIDAETPSHTIGYIAGHVICDLAAFGEQANLLGPEDRYVWRSGVKHDCSKVMEFTATSQGYKNGLGEAVELEDTFVFPMLKSSDIGNARVHCRGGMIVTQQFVGQDTSTIRSKAPKTWEYLKRHAASLNQRGSIIYKNKPPFSVFGVGAYTFAPWKVAISGFYKKISFVKVGPANGRPVVFDDTIYFLPCWTEEEADFIQSLLHSDAAQAFFRSMIHWDEKRPITVEILKRLSIRKLAATLGCEGDYLRFTAAEQRPHQLVCIL